MRNEPQPNPVVEPVRPDLGDLYIGNSDSAFRAHEYNAREVIFVGTSVGLTNTSDFFCFALIEQRYLLNSSPVFLRLNA